MRQALIGFILLLGVIGGIYLLRNKINFTGVPEPKNFVASRPTPKLMDHPQGSLNNKGVAHESYRNRQSYKNSRSRKEHPIIRGKTDSGPPESSEGLPSIYSEAPNVGASEQQPRSAINDPSLSEGEGSDSRIAESANITGKTVYGVPLDAWAKTQANFLPLSRPVADTSGGMRVFLWCMEMKKRRLEYAGKAKCDEMLAQKSELPRHTY